MSERPRICHLITRLIVGGAQRIALETVDFLQRSGWEAELWAGPETGPEGSLHDEAEKRGVRLRTIPHLVRAVSPLADTRAHAMLRRLFAQHQFALVHTHSSKAGIVGRFAAAAAGVPVRVHSVHGWGMTPATGPVVRRLFVTLERAAARRTHRLLAVSEAVRDLGLAHSIGRPEQYAIVRGGVPLPPARGPQERAAAREMLGVPADALVFATVGRLDDAKDPLGALQAAAPVLRELPRARLVFIGDGKLRPALERAVRTSGVSAQTVLTGLRRDAAQLAAACDLFFLSSRWEGFPLAVLEAMAAGLPILAYDVAGVREAVSSGESGFLVPPGDVARWRARLRELLGSEALRHRLGAQARSLAVARFGIERMLSATQEHYEKLLNASAGEAP